MLIRNLSDDALGRYLDVLVQVCSAEQSRAIEANSAQLTQLTDAFNVKCPQCFVVLDPTPDGCCAMKCGTCATYFCWMCLEVCSSNRECHSHVSNCPGNSSRSLFPKREDVDAAHRKLKLLALRAALERTATKDWRENRAALTALQDLQPLLEMHGITRKQVLQREMEVSEQLLRRNVNEKVFRAAFLSLLWGMLVGASAVAIYLYVSQTVLRAIM